MAHQNDIVKEVPRDFFKHNALRAGFLLRRAFNRVSMCASVRRCRPLTQRTYRVFLPDAVDECIPTRGGGERSSSVSVALKLSAGCARAVPRRAQG